MPHVARGQAEKTMTAATVMRAPTNVDFGPSIGGGEIGWDKKLPRANRVLPCTPPSFGVG